MEIVFKELEHIYSKGTPFERVALYQVNGVLESGKYHAIIGHTGSGKSTLLQHMNGLLRPTSGNIQIGEEIVTSEKKKKLKNLRSKVGIVFQFPEHQLFEETVEKDICFGPMNFGVGQEEAKKRAKEMMTLVGLSEDLLERSPFELSGGQMRRVAIAGVLAMEPEVLILDEPTAGLDPRGQLELMSMFYNLYKKGITIILVTHSMEDAAKYADNILVMHDGTVFTEGTPEQVFAQKKALEEIGLTLPLALQYQKAVEEKFNIPFKKTSLTAEDFIENVTAIFQQGRELS